MHKFHHFYKSPEPFDDLMIHPLEAFGYYLQLYAPPFLFAMPLSSFLLYMSICGVCGVLDHSGVKLSVPGLYDTAGKKEERGLGPPGCSNPSYGAAVHGSLVDIFLGLKTVLSIDHALHPAFEPKPSRLL